MRGWALYVAEAGTGGTLRCTTLRGTVCVGLTGAISRLRRGHQDRVVQGLPSYAPFNAANAGAVGPSDVSFSTAAASSRSGSPPAPTCAPRSARSSAGSPASTGTATSTTRSTCPRTRSKPIPTSARRRAIRMVCCRARGRRIVADAASNSLLERVAFGEHLDARRVPLALLPPDRQPGDRRGPRRGRDDAPRRRLLRGRADGRAVHAGSGQRLARRAGPSAGRSTAPASPSSSTSPSIGAATCTSSRTPAARTARS